MTKEFKIEQIGIIHSPHMNKANCPIQGKLNPEMIGKIEIFPDYQEGLETIDTFSRKKFLCSTGGIFEF